MKDITNCVTGTLAVTVYDKDHNVKEHIETHNMVVNMGYYIMANLLAGGLTDGDGVYTPYNHPDEDNHSGCQLGFNPLRAMAIGTIAETGAPSDIDSDDAQVPTLDTVEGDQVKLSHEIARVCKENFVVTHTQDTNTVTLRGIFMPSKATRGYICEAGLFTKITSDEVEHRDMFSRSVFKPVYKDELDTLEITWLIKIGTLSMNVNDNVVFSTKQTINTQYNTDGSATITSDITTTSGVSTVTE